MRGLLQAAAHQHMPCPIPSSQLETAPPTHQLLVLRCGNGKDKGLVPCGLAGLLPHICQPALAVADIDSAHGGYGREGGHQRADDVVWDTLRFVSARPALITPAHRRLISRNHKLAMWGLAEKKPPP